MAGCGVFAGLAGALDVLGWEFRLATNDIQVSQFGFLGIAVALLGRNTAVGTVAAALLFGALSAAVSAQPRPVHLPARAGLQPDADHPGSCGAGGQRRVLVLGILRRGRRPAVPTQQGGRRAETRERGHDRRLALGAEREAARLDRRGARRGGLVHHAAADLIPWVAHAGPARWCSRWWPSAPALRSIRAGGGRQARARRHHRRPWSRARSAPW